MKEKQKLNFVGWLKWQRVVVLLLFFLMVPTFALADSIIPNINNGGWDRSLVTAGNDQLIGLTYSLRTLLWTAGVVLESSQSILTRVADTSFYQDQLGGFYRKKETGASPSSSGSGWVAIKTICNTILIIILLFIAFGTILRVESYNYKYLLVKLIVVALLVNFSGLIAGVVLDFSHIIMGMFSDQIANIGNSIQENSNILKEFSNNVDLSNMNQVSSDLANNMTRTISRVNVNLILASILMFVLGITVLAVAVFLIVRTVILWLLFTLSPIALALYVLPHTRIASLKWWDAFLRYAFTGPLLFFFLYLTVIISRGLSGNSGGGIASQSAVVGDQFIMFSDSGSFLSYLFLVVLLWASIFLSRSLSIAGATQVVGYFKDISKGNKGMRVITKLIDSGGAALEGSKYGQVLHKWTGAPLQVKGDIKGVAGAAFPGGGKGVTKAFQPVLKSQTEASKKALESLLNPSAVGRVLSIVDSKRKGANLGQLGGNLGGMSEVAAMSAENPSEFLRTLWRRFEPQVAPSGSFWKDAKTLNEEINKQIDNQENVRRAYNEMGLQGDKIVDFQAKDLNEKEAQVYKLAWTGELPEYLNKQGKAYSPENIASYLKTNFGEIRGGQVAEKLKMIGEAKKDPSLNVASWNEKKEKFEVSSKPGEAAKIESKDLRTMAPQSLLVKNEKGEYTGFNETGKQFLAQISQDYMKEIRNMRQDTVQAIGEAYRNSHKELGKELAKQLTRKGGIGAVQAETIKAIGKAQMRGPFHVEEVQAPYSQISLGQEFLNKIAARAFKGKKIDTGEIQIVSAGAKKEDMLSPEMKVEQARAASRSFAGKKTGVEKTGLTAEVSEKVEAAAGLKDKQKFLMLGGQKAE